MAKPHHLMMAAMSFIVFCFAIAGTSDYWFYQIGNSDSSSTNISLWAMKTQSKTLNTETKWKVASDKFLQLSCKAWVDHFKAAEAFAILTCITSFFALIGFVLNIVGNKAPVGIACALVTILFSMITWAIGTSIRNNEFCKDDVTGNYKIHLDINNHNFVGFRFDRGWYFFLIPWVVYVLCTIVALIMQATMGEDEEAADNLDKKETVSEQTKEEKKQEENPLAAQPEQKEEETSQPQEEAAPTTRAVAEEQPVAEKTEDSAAEEERKAEQQRKAEEEQKAEEQRKAEEEQKAEEQRKAEEEQKAEEQRKADEERKKREEEEKAAAEEEERLAKDEEAEMAKKLNEEDVERRKNIWADLRERLPTDKKDKAQRRQRFDLFKEFDVDGKKYLTPADLSHGCQTVLGLGQLKKGLAHILPKAHANARAVHQGKGKSKKEKEENVERSEFRLVFVNIKKLFDLWFMFDKMDVANSGSISFAEFEGGVDMIKEWGKEVADPKTEFDAVDAAGNGKISFNEFCDYATANQLQEDEEDTDIDENPDAEDEDEARARNLADVERRKKIWADLAPRLPTNKKSKEERARRFAYFREFDTNSNGFLTLKDVEAGCETVLGLGQLGKGLHHLLPLAHNSARGVANVKGQTEDADQHVQKSEMRLLFVYIHQYFDLWFLFDTLDVANSGHISYDEFVQGMPEVEAWAGIKIDDAKAEFEAADSGKTNEVTFLEFCEWAHHKNSKDE